MIKITAGELCQLLNGKLEGDPNAVITHPAGIDQGSQGAVSFLSNPKYLPFAYTTKSSVIVVNESETFNQTLAPTVIRVKDAYTAFTSLLQKFGGVQHKNGIEQPSFVDSTARLGENVYIGAFSYIGKNTSLGNGVKVYPNVTIGDDCVVGDNTILYSNSTVYHKTKIGTNCTIHSGAVIGSDGFGFAPQRDGSYQKIPQLGNVVIEDNVEIGSNTTIDRATMGSTIIHQGVKLDNLVQIAHNVEIGEHTVIAAQAGISGSTKIGKRCVIGGQVGIVGHIEIADGTRINAQSGVAKAVTKANTAITDSPAFEYHDALRSQVVYRNLPQLEKRLRKLEQLLTETKQANG
jgi:UDP-3-O-[3-hydroxymyristoyl] glucosamine N-acyltransferase